MIQWMRKRFRCMSISAKLTTITLSSSMLVLILGAVLIFIVRVGVLLERQTHEMGLIADMTADFSVGPMDFGQADFARQRLASLHRIPQITSAVLFDDRGRQFAEWERDGSNKPRLHADTALKINLLHDFFSVSRRVGQPKDDRIVGHLVILAETRLLRVQVLEYLLALFTVMLPTILLAVALAVAMQRSISGPIKRLARATEEVSENADYSLRLTTTSDDEISQLYRAFNSLMQAIQDREAETQKVTSQLQGAHDDLDRRVRKRTEQLQEMNYLLSQSLDEKEMLLREIHHRVKNNLNVMTSLLSLQGDGRDGMVDVSILRDAQQRIKTMSLVHETLYSAKNLGELAAHEFIDNVVHSLKQLHRIEQRGIKLRLNTEDIGLSVTYGVPLGLILNELVTNAFKYAFQGRDSGLVEVSFKALGDGRLMLRVADNGVGIPSSKTLDETPTLGFRLIKALVRQIRGELTLERHSGSQIEVLFRPNSNHN